jgi:hypothetical protein
MALLHDSKACSVYILWAIIQSWVRVEICPIFNTFSISSTVLLSQRKPIYKMGIHLAPLRYMNICRR